MRDLSGNGNDGSLISGPQWVAGQHGQAISFNGSGQYVTLTGVNTLSFTFPNTVSVWVKPNTLAARQTIWQFDGNTIGVVLDSVQQQILSGPSGGGAADLSLLSIGVWSHVLVIYLGTGAAHQRVFVDGVDRTVAAKDWWGTQGAARLGCGYNGSSRFPFNGALDDFRIYDRALPQSEISLIAAGLG
jgi:hypothetical protein